MKKLLFTTWSMLLILPFVNGQTSTDDNTTTSIANYLKPGKSKFMLRGYYHTGFENITTGNEEESIFNPGNIAPILMYKQSDRLFFEAEFEGEFEDGNFELGLEYANVSYVLNDYAIVRAGKFLLPFGTFMEKLHPAWINRLSTVPLGYGHDGILPSSEIGVELRGAFYTGSIKLNYQLYAINGPQLKVGGDEPEEAGMLDFGGVEDNNLDKALGGRLGIFPFSNSSLELGVSMLSGAVGSNETEYKDIRTNMYALDLSFVRNVNFLKSMVDIKGQYNLVQTDDANYDDPEGAPGDRYTYDNESSAYYGQLSIRPSMSGSDFLRKLELVGRYSALESPEGALWEQNPTQTAVGLNYWFDWRTVLKIGYQTTDGIGEHDSDETITSDLIYVHWAIGF